MRKISRAQLLARDRVRAEQAIPILNSWLSTVYSAPPNQRHSPGTRILSHSHCAALEISCGAGALADYLAESEQIRVWGIDTDLSNIESARTRFSDNELLQFELWNLNQIQFANRSFDLIISSIPLSAHEGSHHTLEETSRLLKPEGKALFSFRIDNRFVRLVKPQRSLSTPDSALQLLAQYGFTPEFTLLRRKGFTVTYFVGATSATNHEQDERAEVSESETDTVYVNSEGKLLF